MDAYKEIEKLINNSNYSEAKKTWLEMELFEMNQSSKLIASATKHAFEDHANDPQIAIAKSIEGFKRDLINSIKEQVEAEETVNNANNIINNN